MTLLAPSPARLANGFICSTMCLGFPVEKSLEDIKKGLTDPRYLMGDCRSEREFLENWRDRIRVIEKGTPGFHQRFHEAALGILFSADPGVVMELQECVPLATSGAGGPTALLKPTAIPGIRPVARAATAARATESSALRATAETTCLFHSEVRSRNPGRTPSLLFTTAKEQVNSLRDLGFLCARLFLSKAGFDDEEIPFDFITLRSARRFRSDEVAMTIDQYLIAISSRSYPCEELQARMRADAPSVEENCSFILPNSLPEEVLSLSENAKAMLVVSANLISIRLLQAAIKEKVPTSFVSISAVKVLFESGKLILEVTALIGEKMVHFCF